MLRKTSIAVAIIAIGLSVSGCTMTAKELWAAASQVLTNIQVTLTHKKEQLKAACYEAAQAEQQVISYAIMAGVSPDSCRARNIVARERAAMAAVCANADKLDNKVVGDYLRAVKDGLKRATKAVADGC